MNFFSDLKHLTGELFHKLMKTASIDARRELNDRKTTPGRPEALSPWAEPVRLDDDTVPIDDAE